jgi:hypothetical protein
VTVEKSSYAGISPTKTCMNCHAQIWTNAQLLEPVRDSWASGQSIVWTKVHDLPDFVYFNHSIHVNKGIGCASCHGRVDQMPLMYAQNTLQMEWCLDCHRNPAKNLRPTGQTYNMAWEKPTEDKPVWCAATDAQTDVPTAESVSCTTTSPVQGRVEEASLQMPVGGAHEMAGGGAATALAAMPAYRKFTSQDGLGHFLLVQYKIKNPQQLTSCDTCHR